MVKFHHPHTSASPVTAHGYPGHGMPGLPSCSVQLPFIHQLLQVFCMLLAGSFWAEPRLTQHLLAKHNSASFPGIETRFNPSKQHQTPAISTIPSMFSHVFPNWNPGSAEPWRDGTPVHLAMISTGPFIDDLPMTIVIFHGKLSNYRGVLSPTQRNISAIDSRVESKFYCKLLGHLASWKVLGVPKDLPSRTSFLKRRRSQNHNSNHIWPLQVSVAFL